jgi:hypothetical protein
LRYLGWNIWVEIFGLRYLGWNIWVGIFGLEYLGWNIWVGIFGLEYLGWNIWVGIFGDWKSRLHKQSPPARTKENFCIYKGFKPRNLPDLTQSVGIVKDDISGFAIREFPTNPI